jgi:hypothetical protein
LASGIEQNIFGKRRPFFRGRFFRVISPIATENGRRPEVKIDDEWMFNIIKLSQSGFGSYKELTKTAASVVLAMCDYESFKSDYNEWLIQNKG